MQTRDEESRVCIVGRESKSLPRMNADNTDQEKIGGSGHREIGGSERPNPLPRIVADERGWKKSTTEARRKTKTYH